jgi:hypothetical protein
MTRRHRRRPNRYPYNQRRLLDGNEYIQYYNRKIQAGYDNGAPVCDTRAASRELVYRKWERAAVCR